MIDLFIRDLKLPLLERLDKLDMKQGASRDFSSDDLIHVSAPALTGCEIQPSCFIGYGGRRKAVISPQNLIKSDC